MDKTALRRMSRETRRKLADRDFAAAIVRHAESLHIPKGTIVGGYHALPDEADPALLLERLVELGCHIAFPRVAGKGLPLSRLKQQMKAIDALDAYDRRAGRTSGRA